jgi:hypothetical protein
MDDSGGETMDGTHLVAAAMAAVEAWDMRAVADCLTDDFTYSGSGRVMNKREFVAVQSALCISLPDFHFNAAKIHQQGNRVIATVRITGTHLNDLDLSPLGLPVIPATGIYCQLPAEQVEYILVNNKITRITAANTPGRGIPGLLAQLGVEIAYPR